MNIGTSDPHSTQASKGGRRGKKNAALTVSQWLKKGEGSDNPLWVIAGDGSAGFWSVLLHRCAGHRVLWVAGKGSRLLPVLPAAPDHPFLQSLMARLELPWGEGQRGSFLREFRNKAFRNPAWERQEIVPQDAVWGVERRFLIREQVIFSKTYLEIEDELRAHFLSDPDLMRVETSPVHEVEGLESGRLNLVLGSGEQAVIDGLVWADRWEELRRVPGLMSVAQATMRRREPTGVLQVIWDHRVSVGSGSGAGAETIAHDASSVLREGLISSLPGEGKDSEGSSDRRVWGYFTADGKKSVWTLALTPEETEDNHEIAKKLRRLKQCVEKMFGVPPWLPPGFPSFGATVDREQVRCLEGFLYQKGDVLASPIEYSALPGFSLMTEGYGLEASLEQVFSQENLTQRCLESPPVLQQSLEMEAEPPEPPHELNSAT